jgi:hypothetical protein
MLGKILPLHLERAFAIVESWRTKILWNVFARVTMERQQENKSVTAPQNASDRRNWY